MGIPSEKRLLNRDLIRGEPFRAGFFLGGGAKNRNFV